MTQKIEKLTPEQEALFPVFVEKWLKIGLSTEPVDFEKAKLAICKAYRNAGLKEPTQFYTTRSPLEAIAFVQKMFPNMKKAEIINGMLAGSHEAAWLAFYDYFKEVCGIEECKKLDGLFELAESSGWVSVFEDVVVFQDRPTVIKMDEENRLHCENGPAIAYADGYSIYVWHGVKVPENWIMDKASLTPKMALSETNVEKRRCACEILGWVHILKELKAKVIDEDGDPEIGTLVEVNIPEIGKERFLRVLCGTGREFALPVPPNMKTALEANAWTFDVPADVMSKLEVRT